MAPFIEELLYRGIIFGAFSRAFGKLLSFLPVIAAFTFVHWGQSCDGQGRPNWGRVLTVVVLGIVCTGLRALTNRILPAYFAHLGYNFYLAATQFSNYDPVWLLMKKL
jgi:membrane protease YdiL (CAAX protease family)